MSDYEYKKLILKIYQKYEILTKNVVLSYIQNLRIKSEILRYLKKISCLQTIYERVNQTLS